MNLESGRLGSRSGEKLETLKIQITEQASENRFWIINIHLVCDFKNEDLAVLSGLEKLNYIEACLRQLGDPLYENGALSN